MITSCDKSGALYSNTYTSGVINSYGLATYGPYVYIGTNKVYRYNRLTRIVEKACANPECNGNCELESGLTRVIQIYDGKLFFWSYPSKVNSSIIYGYQEILTGDVKILLDISEEEGDGRGAFVFDNYLYYSRTVLRQGADATDKNSYVRYLCRVSINGGNEEFLKETDNESYAMVADNHFIVFSDNRLLAYDSNFQSFTKLFDCEENGYLNFASTCQYVSGKLFFLCMTGETISSQFKGSVHRLFYLVCVDLNTHEISQIIESPVISFRVTDDKIYYSPYVMRHMYIPNDYENNRENVIIFLADASLYECDFDGKNSIIIYSNDKSDYIEDYIVIDNVLYGLLQDFDYIAHKWGKSNFVSINFNDGKIDYAATK